MQDKCPKCGEPLITRTIKKELGYGSIDYPIAQECPKCHWSKDLTGAGDIVSKPLAPETKKKDVMPHAPPKAAPPKAVPPEAQPKPLPSADINKIITIALAILVLGGIVWAFFLYPGAPKQVESPKTTATATVTQTTVQITATPVPEITPTGNKALVKLDSRRGFSPNTKASKLGDEIIWENTEAETVTLISNDKLFADQLLPYGNEYSYILKKTGTYSFYLKENTNLTGTIIVES
jgi:plastocyanin